MKRIALAFVLAGLLVLAGGFAAAWSGIYNVAASAGHWAITAWFLRFTMENSVETYSASLPVPPLADPALIDRGAGHYETGCAPCHGAPGVASNVITRQLLPPPPSFLGSILPWSDEELFWIVKHGLKYSAMPPWPAQNRDDEVWAMVAFLRQLPDMTPEAYAAVAKGVGNDIPVGAGEPPLPEEPGQLFSMTDAALIGACARCHGLDGSGRPSGAFPRLDIQRPEYLARALDEFASGVRASGIMQPVAAALNPPQIARMAEHYSGGAPRPSLPESHPAEELELGRRIATEGMPNKQVAPCAQCHGLENGPENRLYPAINGQYSAYIVNQLQLWVAEKRGGGGFAEIMQAAVRDLSPPEIDAVARFYASLPPLREAGLSTEGTPLPAP